MNIDEEIDKIVSRAADDLATRMKRLVARYVKAVVRQTVTTPSASRTRESSSRKSGATTGATSEKPGRRQSVAKSTSSGGGHRGRKSYSDNEFTSDSE